MEIKKLIDTLQHADNREVGGRKARDGSAQQPSVQQGDRVTLSTGAQTYRAVLTSAQASPGVRTERVEQIKQQVENNTYQMNSRKTAEKMLEQERDSWGREV